MKLFGTAGIRGFTNKDITPDFAMKVGLSFGTYLRQNSRVAVARDTRFGAECITNGFLSGLSATGVTVEYGSIFPTPGVASYVCETKADAGAVITGSHIPPEMLGIILLNDDGSDICGENARKIEEIFENNSFRLVNYNEIKSVATVNMANIYLADLLRNVSLREFWNRRFRILFDPVNGALCNLIDTLFSRVGINLIKVNDEHSGIPNRKSEPRRDNLIETAKKVVENNCDLGIATDIDGDRVLFITSKGKVISEDVMGALFAEYELRLTDNEPERPVIVTPINSSEVIREVCKKHDAKIIYTRIGPPEISNAIRNNHAIFAYEETGKYFFAREKNFACSLRSTIKLLEIMLRENKTLEELVTNYPEYPQKKVAIHFDTPTKINLDEYSTKFQTMLDEPFEVLTLDGYKFIFTDGSWLLIRASGTEPLLRIFAEAKSMERVDKLIELAVQVVNRE